jgi:acyl carrier protein
MHLDDAPLAELDDDRFAAVLRPKMAGAEILHHLTTGRDLDLFLLYSSVTANTGNLAQAPYTAGNAHLEALVRARRHAGLPGTAIAWGPIAETGYVARNDLAATMAGLGFEPVTPADAFATADLLLAADTEVAGVGRYRWPRARRLLPALAAPRYHLLAPPGAEDLDDSREELLRSLATMAPDDALGAITDALRRILADVLHTDLADIDPDRPLTDLGLDSLMGAEFLVRTGEHFGIRMAAGELASGGQRPADAARLIHGRLGLDRPGPGQNGPAAARVQGAGGS